LANSGAVYVFVRSDGTWTQQAYLRAFNAGIDDFFGQSLSLSGDVLAVGAPAEDATAAGDAFNNGLSNSGAVYVYTRSASTWTIQSRLKAPNAGEDDRFGSAVAISPEFLAISATSEDNDSGNLQTDNNNGFNDGAVYLYVPNGMDWTLDEYLKASTTDSGDNLGTSLAISGNTLVAGAEFDGQTGRCAVFTHDGSTWSEQAILEGSTAMANDSFGASVAISGDTIVAGAPFGDANPQGTITDVNHDYGAAYVFTRSAGVWTESAVLTAYNGEPADNFGKGVAVSGDFAAVGSPGEDSDLNGSRTPGVIDSGAVYLYRRNGSGWARRSLLKGSANLLFGRFGTSVAMENGTLFAGATGEDDSSGSVYAFLISEVAPTLRIKGKKTVRVDATTARYTIRGTANDADGDLAFVEAKDSRPKGKKVFRPAKGTAAWTYRAPLKPGRNKIQVRAVDQGGNSSPLQQITVIRK
jgi:hypothetical protein